MAIRNVDDLIKKVKSDIVKKFNEERSPTRIKDVNRRHVSREVYAVYEPEHYKRRADNGGLTDPDNISVVPEESNSGVVLTISNNTRPIGFDKAGMNSSFLTPVVEYGTGGEEPWEEPRPFMEATENELRNGELIKNIIKEIDYIK